MSAPNVARGPGESPAAGSPPVAAPDPHAPHPPLASTATATARRAAAAAPPACTISALVVRANGRACNGSRVLQVVADPAERNASFSRREGPITLSGTHSWGGEATVSATVTSSAAGRKQSALSQATDAPSAWETGATKEFRVPAPSNTSVWPARATPTTHYVHGRGCDDARLYARVESFPSQQYELQAGVDIFQRWVDTLNTAVGDKLGRTFGPISVAPSITGPSGTLGVKWGWKEQSDWQAAYEVEVNAGLNPAFGFGLEVQLSLLHIATTVGLGACGIPAPLASRLADLGREYLADAFVFVGVELQFSIVGAICVKYYPTGGNRTVGRLTPALQGNVSLGIGARLGSANWLHVEARGRATTGLGFQAGFEVAREGVTLSPQVNWPGVTLSITMSFRSGSTTLRESASSWTPISARTLWQPAQPLRLTGRG